VNNSKVNQNVNNESNKKETVKAELNSNTNAVNKSSSPPSDKKRETVKVKSTPETAESVDKKREAKNESVKAVRRDDKTTSKSSDRNHVTNDKSTVKASSNVSTSPRKTGDYGGRSVEPQNDNERGKHEFMF